MGCPTVLLAAALLTLLAPGTGAPISRKASRNKLLLVSFDGFRWDYDQDVDTPNLDAMALDGVKARYMTPAFVTMTSPCHFTLVTGLKDRLLLLPGRQRHLPGHGRDAEREGRRSAQLRRREGVEDQHRHGDEVVHGGGPGPGHALLRGARLHGPQVRPRVPAEAGHGDAGGQDGGLPPRPHQEQRPGGQPQPGHHLRPRHGHREQEGPGPGGVPQVPQLHLQGHRVRAPGLRAERDAGAQGGAAGEGVHGPQGRPPQAPRLHEGVLPRLPALRQQPQDHPLAHVQRPRLRHPRGEQGAGSLAGLPALLPDP
uniref:Ectonucleotide pyrophosphatase/phosphodiesterase 7 n=1 Tax=Suricata suricatta TaxID=37032 RepID=A0A673VF00_SURSU